MATMTHDTEKKIVLSMIRKHSGISMVSISNRTKISYKKVIKIRKELIADGKVISTRLGITNRSMQYVNIVV